MVGPHGLLLSHEVLLLHQGRLVELSHSYSPLEESGAGALVLGAREAPRCMNWSKKWLRPGLRWQTCSLSHEAFLCPGQHNWQDWLGMCAAASLTVQCSSRPDYCWTGSISWAKVQTGQQGGEEELSNLKQHLQEREGRSWCAFARERRLCEGDLGFWTSC